MGLDLLSIVDRIISKSNFYQKKIQNSVHQFSDLPFTTKKELLEDQKKNPPYGSNICVNENYIQRIHKTSGTTNKPLLLVLTLNDIKNTIDIGSQCFKRAGLKSSDTVIHCLNYNMWAGGYTDHQSLESTGAAVVPFGVGNTQNLIETILLLKPTAIHCTPSYLSIIEVLLKDKFNLKPIDLGLKLGLFGAESGLQNEDFRNSIESKWGFRAVNANYGLSDVLSMFGSECEYSHHLHFTGLDILLPEVIDPLNLEFLPIEKDVVGELVLTNLKKEAQPLIRYRTNDIIKIVSTAKCQCGDSAFQFDIIGRTDNMIVVKGINFFISNIDGIINRHLESLSGHYQFHVNRLDPIDRCILKVEILNYKLLEKKRIEQKLLNEFYNKLYIVPEIIFKKKGTLPRTDGKSKKIFRTL